MPDFGKHPDDYMAVNLAIPVADAEQPNVTKLYHAIFSARLGVWPIVSRDIRQ